MKLSVLDLFSGIGGFSLGLEATGGFETAAFCEINPYARRVLAHHWPEVPIHGSVVDLCGADITADVICGGFPCQDISLSGSGAGLDGDRSGLWFQFLRLIDEIRPRWAIIENVSALRGRGLDTVLRGLAAIGYDAEWHCVPASALGAPHRRDRIWIVAYPHGEPRHERRPGDASEGEGRRDAGGSRVSADTLADAYSLAEQQPAIVHNAPELRQQEPRLDVGGRRELLADTDKPRLEIKLDGQAEQFAAHIGAHGWSSEPAILRVAYGIPARVHRLTALGNAIVPVMAYVIGRAILEAEG